jgi:hypothetical protein
MLHVKNAGLLGRNESLPIVGRSCAFSLVAFNLAANTLWQLAYGVTLALNHGRFAISQMKWMRRQGE